MCLVMARLCWSVTSQWRPAPFPRKQSKSRETKTFFDLLTLCNQFALFNCHTFGTEGKLSLIFSIPGNRFAISAVTLSERNNCATLTTYQCIEVHIGIGRDDD